MISTERVVISVYDGRTSNELHFLVIILNFIKGIYLIKWIIVLFLLKRGTQYAKD